MQKKSVLNNVLFVCFFFEKPGEAVVATGKNGLKVEYQLSLVEKSLQRWISKIICQSNWWWEWKVDDVYTFQEGFEESNGQIAFDLIIKTKLEYGLIRNMWQWNGTMQVYR